MKIMLKMGQLALKCGAQIPKHRPTMTQLWQELEEALFSADSLIRQTASGSYRSIADGESSQSYVSVNGVGLQRFHVDMDSLSFESASLRCLEASSISMDV